MRKAVSSLLAALLASGCSHHPRSDHEMTREAQRAVDDQLDAQGKFSLMSAFASQDIACGHVTASDVPGRGDVDADFVYRDQRVIMDNEPDYEAAAIACDRAAGGGNSATGANVGGAEPYDSRRGDIAPSSARK